MSFYRELWEKRKLETNGPAAAMQRFEELTTRLFPIAAGDPETIDSSAEAAVGDGRGKV